MQPTLQDGLDNNLPDDKALRDQSTTLLKPLIDQALQAIKAGEPAEAVLSHLMTGYPMLDSQQLQDTLAKAFFIADLAGQWEAQQDINHAKS